MKDTDALKKYTSVADAFDKGNSTYEVFKEGWTKDAFKVGAAWGDGVVVQVFYGFVFKKSRDKSGVIDVVAYDQLRYLKNKDTYVGLISITL